MAEHVTHELVTDLMYIADQVRRGTRTDWWTATQLEELAERIAGEFCRLEPSARRWDRLVGSARVRVIGSARLGEPSAHLGVEFWGAYLGITPEHSAASVAALTQYVDGLNPLSR